MSAWISATLGADGSRHARTHVRAFLYYLKAPGEGTGLGLAGFDGDLATSGHGVSGIQSPN